MTERGELKWGDYGVVGNAPGLPIGYAAPYLLRNPSKMLQFPIQQGDKWSDDWSGYRATTEVKKASEPITVPAGTFKDCFEIETRIVKTEEAKDEEAIINSYCGTRRLWLAKDVGLVKMQYEHNDGSITEMRLISYDVPSKDGSFFPFEPGVEWTYYWHNDHHAHGVQETWVLIGKPSKPLKLDYNVSILDEYGLIRVNCKVGESAPIALGLEIAPGWAGGQNYPANVFGLAAKDFKGNRLPIFGEKGRWLVKNIPPEGFEFSYVIVPKQNKVQVEEEPTLSHDFSFVFGYAIFIVPSAYGKAEITVNFEVPTNWKIATSWGCGETSYQVDNFHPLRHSIIGLGDYRL
jgi:hypothetical protein